MMILNVLFFHPPSIGMCMYECRKCKKCKKCPSVKVKIKMFLRNIWRR